MVVPAEVVTQRVQSVEEKAIALAKDLATVKEKVEDIDNRLTRVEVKQDHTNEKLDKLIGMQDWLIKIIVGGFVAAMLAWIIKGGLLVSLAAAL